MDARCKTSVTIIIYLPNSVSMPGLIRRVMELGGRVNSVNEELRRIVVRSPLPEAHRITREILSKGVPHENIAFEIAITCHGIGRWKSPQSFLSKRVRNRFVAAGVCGKRVVVVELKNNLMLIKVGRPSRSLFMRTFPPPSEMTLPALPTEDDIRQVVECVLRGGEEQ